MEKEKEHDTLVFIRPDLSTGCPLPLAASPVHAGFPSPAEDFLEAPLDLNRALIRDPASTFFVRVEGDSMTGDGIDDGDLLVVDKSLPAYDGCVAVCYVDGEFTLKHLIRHDDGSVTLEPSNPRYRKIHIPAADLPGRLLVWGIVRHVIKTLV